MTKKLNLAFGPGVVVRSVVFRENRWLVSADGAGVRSCPECGGASTSRHSRHVRRLQDLPIQGVPVVLELRLGRWRCLNERCATKDFRRKTDDGFSLCTKNAARQRPREIVRPRRGRQDKREVAGATGDASQRQCDSAAAQTSCI